MKCKYKWSSQSVWIFFCFITTYSGKRTSQADARWTISPWYLGLFTIILFVCFTRATALVINFDDYFFSFFQRFTYINFVLTKRPDPDQLSVIHKHICPDWEVNQLRQKDFSVFFIYNYLAINTNLQAFTKQPH